VAAAIITSLAPLAENLISAWVAYEQARKATDDASIPTAEQLVASIEAIDAEIDQQADAQLGIKE
jgi:hypothetical protein